MHPGSPSLTSELNSIDDLADERLIGIQTGNLGLQHSYCMAMRLAGWYCLLTVGQAFVNNRWSCERAEGTL